MCRGKGCKAGRAAGSVCIELARAVGEPSRACCMTARLGPGRHRRGQGGSLTCPRDLDTPDAPCDVGLGLC